MDSPKNLCAKLVHNKPFEFFITVIILLNSILIGIQTSYNTPSIEGVQLIILYIFTFEIIVRFIAEGNIIKFFKSGWNIFDLSLVLIAYVPESLVAGSGTFMALRVLRVFRILRLLRSAKELKLIVSVLIRSTTSMFWNLVLFLIFVYLYAVMGVSVFKLPDPNQLTGEAKHNYELFIQEAPHAPTNSPDPYGNIGEAVFTLFRSLTGEDWTDLRYNQLTAVKYGIIKVSPTFITFYHVSWFCLAAFLLLNLVTGAVLSNYQASLEEREEEKKRQKALAEGNPDPEPEDGAPALAETE